MARAVVVGIRLTDDEHAALARAAEDDHRSMSAVAGMAVIEWLRTHGYGPATATAVMHRRPRAKAKAKVRAKAAATPLRRLARRSS